MDNFNELRTVFGMETLEAKKAEVKKSLMIIDDNQDVINNLEVILKRRYHVVSCLSFDEARKKLDSLIKEYGLPVILLDIKMAVKDGIEVFKLLKEINPELPIIFHSAYPGSDEHAKAVKNLPHDGYLTKGTYMIDELLDTLKKVFNT